MRVTLADTAKADLVALSAFIGRDSPARASAFVSRLKRQCRSLSENFLRNPVFSRSENDSIHKAIYREYIIFYKVMADRVVILRIVHGARDLDAIFDP
jgi:toxin ParE1/3/4